jgi:hypothetical protein
MAVQAVAFSVAREAATTGLLPGPSAPGCHPEEVRAYRVGELNLDVIYFLPSTTLG